MVSGPTTVRIVVDGGVVVVVVVAVVVVRAGAVVVVVVVARVPAAVVVVVARAGAVVVVEALVEPLPPRGDPLLGALVARVVVVAPRELSDNVAGFVWKLINPANPATVATATIPARFMIDVFSW